MSRPVRPESSFPGPAFFVGVLPPPKLSARILAWQRALDHLITAPHVTLKAPGGLNVQQTLACREVCRRTPPFDLRLGGVQTFGGRVIYLAASGEGLSALHAALVAAVGTPAGEFELDNYHPHLTLALSYRPVQYPWSDVLASARIEFADLERAAVTSQVRDAALFRKNVPGQPYREAEHWALGGANPN